MKIRKRTVALSLGLALVAGTAVAQQTYAGAICMPAGGITTGLTNFGFTANENTFVMNVSCPTSTTLSIGNARWSARVTDNNPSQGFEACFGLVSSSSGLAIAASPPASTGLAFTGSTVVTTATTSGGFSSSFSHVLQCIIPARPAGGNASNILNIVLD